MRLKPFKIERYFAEHEFTAPYILCASDCEPLSLKELIELSDEETRGLWENLSLGYTETAGHPLLRQAIAELYETASAEDIQVTAPEEGIFIALNVLISPGDHVIATWPGYQSLHELPLASGCRLSFWKPEKKKFPAFSIARLKALLRRETRLIIVNFPHNPTGAVLDDADFHELARWAAERKITVFSDEIYRFLEIDPADRRPSFSDMLPTAVSLGGLSKAFGLPGLRIGWLVARDRRTREKMAAFRDYTTICSSAPSEILAIMALGARERILSRQRRILLSNLQLLDRFFEEYRDLFDWVRPRGSSVALPALKSGRDAGVFCGELMKKEGVLLVPGKIFGCDPGRFRIGFGRRNLPQALERLEVFVKSIRARRRH